MLLMFALAEDLEGLKVSHDLSKLEDGESHILTLKDSRILDNEGNLFHPSYLSWLTTRFSRR